MIKSFTLITLCVFALNFSLKAIDGPDQVKMVMAKQKLYAGQFIGALNLYKEVLAKNQDDASVLYYVGYCNYELKKYDLAAEHLQKAIATNKDVKPETHLVLGKIYLTQEKVNEALTEFNAFKSSAKSKDAQLEDVDVYIEHCNNAKKYLPSPNNDIKIANLGTAVNSKFDDQTPCISADGMKLVFTTRRPQTTDSPTDIEGDGKYFQDILIYQEAQFHL